jgi:hypothetical protein
MAKKIDRLSTTLIKILKAHGLEGRLSEYRIFGSWEKSVGRVIARHAQPQAVRGKKLTLIVDSPAWMQQLSLLKPEIIEKVNRSLGRDEIKDIVLKLGEVASAERPSDGMPVRASLDADERDQIDRHAREISDPEIRESFRHLVEKDFLNRKREQKK